MAMDQRIEFIRRKCQEFATSVMQGEAPEVTITTSGNTATVALDFFITLNPNVLIAMGQERKQGSVHSEAA